MPIPTDDERIGSVVAGKYRIEELLGRGGMGSVFRATHTWTERQVALKFLHAEEARDPQIVKRFLREARAAAALRHPNAVDVLDMGEDPEAGVYMVLELLEGLTLSYALRLRGRLGYAETLKTMLPIMDALQAAHARNIVHRDIKPENIFLSKQSGVVVPKLLDFGIAKVQKADESSRTQAGLMIGTPTYMSPEQVQGRTDLGTASDIWALGVVLFECLSWRHPFEAESVSHLFVKILTESPCPIERHVPALAGDVSAILQTAMARDPKERYRSVADLAKALREASPSAPSPAVIVERRPITVVSDPAPALPPSRPAFEPKTSSAAWTLSLAPRVLSTAPPEIRRRTALAAGLVVVVALAGWLMFGRGERAAPADAPLARPSALPEPEQRAAMAASPSAPLEHDAGESSSDVRFR
jgi:serine/threonine protein kinase